ncbi:hypothetical protein CIT292_07548 [Citrobacter youngae ATCC 29220]|uniref:Uncharacterized protein n=1 Tax=Citrobacter youngae ATCC 29220 TaxID=500640 RepID=D4BAQ4_9ENTR|nr:hypothetical protein CIT292_07548 [Citrobacter youngae ATCC 29220]
MRHPEAFISVQNAGTLKLIYISLRGGLLRLGEEVRILCLLIILTFIQMEIIKHGICTKILFFNVMDVFFAKHTDCNLVSLGFV